MLNIEIEDNGLTVRMSGLEQALRDLSPVWPQVHDVFTDFMKQEFQTEGGYTGQRWVSLSPGYERWKQRNHPDKSIMHLTERLYGSFTEQGHTDHVYYSGASFMESGSRVPYAWAQHAGYPPNNLPARTLIGKMSKTEGKRIVYIVLAFLFRSLRLGRRG